MSVFDNLDQAVAELDNITNEFVSKTKIKQFRLRHGISQRELAEAVGVNVRTVQRWESGDRTPHESVIKLLELLDETGDVKCDIILL